VPRLARKEGSHGELVLVSRNVSRSSKLIVPLLVDSPLQDPHVLHRGSRPVFNLLPLRPSRIGFGGRPIRPGESNGPAAIRDGLTKSQIHLFSSVSTKDLFGLPEFATARLCQRHNDLLRSGSSPPFGAGRSKTFAVKACVKHFTRVPRVKTLLIENDHRL